MKMKYVICTDGEEVVESKVVVDHYELTELNRKATEATGGNFYWVVGNSVNYKWPKAEVYKHTSEQNTKLLKGK